MTGVRVILNGMRQSLSYKTVSTATKQSGSLHRCSGLGITHDLLDGHLGHDSSTGQECRDPAREPSLGRGSVHRTLLSVPGGVVHEDKEKYEADGIGDDDEPEGPSPVTRGCRDEGADGRAGSVTEIEEEVEYGEGSSTLVEEKHVDQASGPQDSDDGAEETGEPTRDYEQVEVILFGHQGSPDAGKESTEKRPKHSGLTADDAGNPVQNNRSDDHTSESAGVLVKR